MQKSLDYINGVIAAKEVNLLGDKISKLCDMTAEDERVISSTLKSPSGASIFSRSHST